MKSAVMSSALFEDHAVSYAVTHRSVVPATSPGPVESVELADTAAVVGVWSSSGGVRFDWVIFCSVINPF